MVRWIILVLPLALAACGVKGDIEPPEAEKATYTYPQTYPAPQTVVPQDGTTGAAQPVPPAYGDDRSTTTVITSQ